MFAHNKRYWSLVFCFALLMGLRHVASAQTYFSPDMLTVYLEPGKTATASLDLYNDSQETKQFTLSLEYRQRGSCKAKVNQWASVHPSTILLSGGKKAKIVITLKGMETEAKDECILGVFVSERIHETIDMDLRQGIPVYVLFGRGSKSNGKIKNMDARSIPGNKLKIGIEIENKGTVHLTPFGMIWFEKNDGTQVWQKEFRTDQIIFSSASREIELKMERPASLPRQGQMGVRVFWGNLYSMDKTGVPESVLFKRPLKEMSLFKQ